MPVDPPSTVYRHQLSDPLLPADSSASDTAHPFRVKALYAYTASPDDPNEISFYKGEILDIIDKNGKWWQVRKEDGTVGIAPSNYLDSRAWDTDIAYSYRAKALYAYTASPDDPNEVSFSKGEILDIIDKNGRWWQVRKEDGTVGIAPSNYLQIL